MKQKIVKKLIIIGCGITVCMVIFLSSTIMINKKGISDGFVINIAGRERMLSQKISKEVFILNSQDRIDFSELDRALNEFQVGLDILRHGSKAHNSQASENQEIIKQLEIINKAWLEFRQSVLIFRAAIVMLNDNKNFLDQHNSDMLALSDNIVKSAVQQNMPGQDIDDSGRQRMLTQRMAYHLMRYTNKWDMQSYQDFYDAYNLYNETILRFYIDNKYKQYPALFLEIENTYKFWLEYSRHINSVLADQKNVVDALDKIASQNLKLLNEIEIVVGLYTDDSIFDRTLIHQVQLFSALVLFILAVYAFRFVRKIKITFDEFLQKSKELANTQIGENLNKDKIGEMMTMEGENELSEISKNISKFITNVSGLERNSNRVIELNNNITEEITQITDKVITSLETLDISDEEKAKIISEINLSEDIAIQTSEELISTSKLLTRLKKSLDVIAEYYNTKKEKK